MRQESPVWRLGLTSSGPRDAQKVLRQPLDNTSHPQWRVESSASSVLLLPPDIHPAKGTS